ncbi:MAG: amino-acid N-acetyltransferase [Nesterenkonia sp.]|nr:amino-acid N-acetyltransferase [Nesterenkonia sp.]
MTPPAAPQPETHPSEPPADRSTAESSRPRFVLRRARTPDVRRILDLARPLVERRVLVAKEAVSYYESLQEFHVAESDGGDVVGFGALHVMWEDLAEVRTLAASEDWLGTGVGGALLHRLLDDARELGVSRVFCLTFEVEFFTRHGFRIMENQEQVDPEVYSELLRSQDEGVAEFLDLARVKPNTLGNTRMIIDL